MARAAAWLNLFNLLPIGFLDGGRGFRALSQMQRFVVTAALGAAWAATHDGLVALLFFVSAFRSIGGRAPEEHDTGALAQFLLLIAALTALTSIPIEVAR